MDRTLLHTHVGEQLDQKKYRLQSMQQSHLNPKLYANLADDILSIG